MRRMLSDIQSGDYARRWMEEYRRGGPDFGRRRREEKAHSIESVGKSLREMMPFLSEAPTAQEEEKLAVGAPR